MANLLIFTVLNAFCTAYSKSEVDCLDWQGEKVAEGKTFIPNGDDLCKVCSCDRGFPTACHTVSCSPDCLIYEAIEGVCCGFICIGDTPDKPGTNNKDRKGNGTYSGHPTNLNTGDATNLSLRLVASTVATLLIIGIMIIMIHRLRQRRILIMLRRMQQEEEDDTVAYVAEFNSVDLGAPPYEDPPPPYTPPKPSDNFISPLAPPSYESVTANDNNNTVSVLNGTTLHEVETVENGRGTHTVQGQGTSTNEPPTCNNHSDIALVLMTSAVPSTSTCNQQQHSYISPAKRIHRRCKHAAKRKRHSVGNQTENVNGRLNVLSASYTQGDGEIEYLYDTDETQRHTLPKQLSNRGVSTEQPIHGAVLANDIELNTVTVGDSANQLGCTSSHGKGREIPHSVALCNKDTSSKSIHPESRCNCNVGQKQKRHLKRSDSIEIEFNNSSPRHCWQNEVDIACNSRLNGCQGKTDISVRARAKEFEIKLKLRTPPQHSQSFDASTTENQYNKNSFVNCVSFNAMLERDNECSLNGESEHLENSQYSLCSETGEMRKSVHSNSESTAGVICRPGESHSEGNHIYQLPSIRQGEQRQNIERQDIIGSSLNGETQSNTNHQSSNGPQHFCEKVKTEDRKRYDSPETFRRISMANEPNNTYTKYGFLDNPNSIEAADVILRDKRIRNKHIRDKTDNTLG